MKINLPCEVIRDLLPNYIDGLASKQTLELVKGHLAECKACEHVCNSMKDGNKELESRSYSLEKEKKLFKKINRKLNKKTRIAVIAGAIGIVLVISVTNILFSMPLKTLPSEAVNVSAAVYPLQNIVTGTYEGGGEESVVISKGDDQDDDIYSIRIPEMQNASIGVTQSMIDDGKELTYISWESPSIISEVESEIKTVGNQKVMYVTGFKTTILGSKASEGAYTLATIEIQKIDKIVYVEENGTENVLWENGITD
ncbi:MAG: zf-HC2 domain-containing protein [Cellulosilyticum sp.]|nr:zf-HC2 domain-containing protein [Cellulosilyticum sp.]